MKLAAVADIHGNGVALEAVLADIAALGIGEVVNLGDHLSGPLEARRTADLLMERSCADTPHIPRAVRLRDGRLVAASPCPYFYALLSSAVNDAGHRSALELRRYTRY
jgi:hypothetical protein